MKMSIRRMWYQAQGARSLEQRFLIFKEKGMILHVPNVLNGEQVARCREVIT